MKAKTNLLIILFLVFVSIESRTQTNNSEVSELTESTFEYEEIPLDYIAFAQLDFANQSQNTSDNNIQKTQADLPLAPNQQPEHTFRLVGRFAITNNNPPRVGVKKK